MAEKKGHLEGPQADEEDQAGEEGLRGRCWCAFFKEVVGEATEGAATQCSSGRAFPAEGSAGVKARAGNGLGVSEEPRPLRLEGVSRERGVLKLGRGGLGPSGIWALFST